MTAHSASQIKNLAAVAGRYQKATIALLLKWDKETMDNHHYCHDVSRLFVFEDTGCTCCPEHVEWTEAGKVLKEALCAVQEQEATDE